MSKVITSDVHYTDISDAIRAKKGITDTFRPKNIVGGLKKVWTRNPTPKIKSLKEFFKENRNLAILNNPDFSTSQVVSFYDAFYGATNLTEVTLLDTTSAQSCYRMFYGCSKLTSVCDLYLPNNTTMEAMFRECTVLKNFGDITISKVTTVDGMFQNCKALTDPPELDTSTVTNFHNMFQTCTSLIETPEYDTVNGTDFRAMFYGDTKLKTPRLTSTSKGTNMNSMFRNCQSLESLGEWFDTANNTNVTELFWNCTKLKSLPLLDFSKVTTIGGSGTTNNTFYNCTSLSDISFVENSIKVSGLSFAYTRKLSRDSILSILKGLNTAVASSRSLRAPKFCIDGVTLVETLVNSDAELMAAYMDAVSAGWTIDISET